MEGELSLRERVMLSTDDDTDESWFHDMNRKCREEANNKFMDLIIYGEPDLEILTPEQSC